MIDAHLDALIDQRIALYYASIVLEETLRQFGEEECACEDGTHEINPYLGACPSCGEAP